MVVPLKQVDKIAPRADCRGHKRFAEGVSDSESQEEERETWWVRRRQQQQGQEDGLEQVDTTSLDGDGVDCEQLQDDDSAGTTNAATSLWVDDKSPMTLERRHLELFRRQVVAEEAIAECTRAQVEATRQRIRVEREQLRLARDELELKLFTMMAASEPEEEEDRVTYEFVAMKRRQVADRLTREEKVKERQSIAAMESRLQSQRTSRRR